MTRSRNLEVTLRALARAAIVCLFFVVTTWSGSADAFIFAPICNEDASSGIAPIPVNIRDYGEIQSLPCPPSEREPDLDHAVPPDRPDRPKTEAEFQTRLVVPYETNEMQWGSPPLERELEATAGAPRTAEHSKQIYRPPR